MFLPCIESSSFSVKPETTEASVISVVKALSFSYLHFRSCLIIIMILAMSKSSASFKTTMIHAPTRVSNDIDVKRPENHHGIVSTRFNFNISQGWPIAITVVKRRCTKSRRKPLPLPSATYFMMRFAEESDCRLLTWLYGAKIPCTIEKICKSTRKRYLHNSYSC